MAQKKTPAPATEANSGTVSGTIKEGHIEVSELFATRAAAPSPFGDDQTFPLPVDRLTHKPYGIK